MKLPWTFKLLVGFCLLATTAYAVPDHPTEPSPIRVTPLSDEEIRTRLQQIDLPFDPRLTSTVKEYIKRYTVNGYKDSELILGRTSMYFSIFEHYLSIYQLPKSLKYLPIMESGLIANNRSHAGAVGLWQFVPISARHFKLEMNTYVDERLDPYRSTEAAVQMLDYLYQQLGDWPLALAAYNAGLGKVQRAIKQAKCANFWDIQKYLPVETQRYVPIFIAAAYLGNYYQDHGLQPNYPNINLQDARAFRVYKNLSFYSLSKAIDLPVNVLVSLNPSFIKKQIPYNRKGHFLRVPPMYAEAVRAYLDKQQELNLKTPENYFESFYVVTPGDKMKTLASLFECSKEELMAWNGLYHSDVVANQHLRIYLPKNNRIIRP